MRRAAIVRAATFALFAELPLYKLPLYELPFAKFRLNHIFGDFRQSSAKNGSFLKNNFTIVPIFE
jgi:hypothetical protein